MKLGYADLPQLDLDFVAQAIAPDLSSYRDSNIVLTGGTGFVGSWLTACLAEFRRQSGIELSISVVVRDAASAAKRLGAELWGEVQPVIGDVVVEQWATPPETTHVIHGATPASLRTGSGDPRQVLLTSVLGTENLIRSIADENSSPRVLHLSSGAVYGPQRLNVSEIPESWEGGPTPFQSSSPYAEGKRAAESLLEEAGRSGLLTPIQARLFAFLGPRLPTDEHFAIGNFAACAAGGRPIQINGNGRTIRSYLDARDMAIWLLRLLVTGVPGRPYNVGSPEGFPLSYWASLCSTIAGTSIEVMGEDSGDRPSYVPKISNSEELRLVPSSPDLQLRLQSWVDWLRQQ